MPDKIFFIEKDLPYRAALCRRLIIAVAAIMPHAQERSKRSCEESVKSMKMFSAKRNGTRNFATSSYLLWQGRVRSPFRYARRLG
jgi:hypothetical protein